MAMPSPIASFRPPVDSSATRDGEPTNATSDCPYLLDVLEKDQPRYLLVAFDRGLSGRNELYPDYKGTREKMPDELRVQIERIHTLVNAFNIPIMELDGYEADDVLGTLARQAEAQDTHVLIVTGDRDLLQIVDEHIWVRLPPGRWNKTDQLFDPAAFREKYEGLEPPQLIDLKALMGDSSDNIPGVKGIGEKGAIKLIQQFGSLENLYDHLDALPKGQRAKLEEGRDSAFSASAWRPSAPTRRSAWTCKPASPTTTIATTSPTCSGCWSSACWPIASRRRARRASRRGSRAS
jgi:DNA polymerase-1